MAMALQANERLKRIILIHPSHHYHLEDIMVQQFGIRAGSVISIDPGRRWVGGFDPFAFKNMPKF